MELIRLSNLRYYAEKGLGWGGDLSSVDITDISLSAETMDTLRLESNNNELEVEFSIESNSYKNKL